MEVKYLFKTPDGQWECRKVERYSKRFCEYIEQPWCEGGYTCLVKHYYDEDKKLKRRHLTVVFDDLGVLDYHLDLVKYNFSIYGKGEMFGNVAVFSQDQYGEDIDITEKDLEYLKKQIFIHEGEHTTMKTLEKFLGKELIDEKIKEYKDKGIIA